MVRRYYILILLLGFIILTSCDPIKRIERNKAKWCPLCEAKDSIVVKDSFMILYRDTMLYVQLPSDTSKISSEELNYIISQLGYIYEPGYYRILRNSSKYVIGEIWMTRKGLTVYSYLKDTTFPIRLENAIKEVSVWKEKYELKKILVPVPYEVKVKVVPWFYKWSTMTFWIVVVGAIAYYIIKSKSTLLGWVNVIVKLVTNLFKKKNSGT